MKKANFSKLINIILNFWRIIGVFEKYGELNPISVATFEYSVTDFLLIKGFILHFFGRILIKPG